MAAFTPMAERTSFFQLDVGGNVPPNKIKTLVVSNIFYFDP